jgi:CheY-like chemotaxis protein
LSNAIKFSPPESTISVCAQQQDRALRLTVSDQGRGIPPDKLESVFERFQQVDASDSRQKGGTGLGLAICRSIIEQHDGSIWVESQEGQGSTFHIVLPLLLGRAQGATQQQVTGNGPLVMVCDNDASNLEVARALLEHHGYRVLTVSAGSEALPTAIACRPDTILLDIMMPGTDGWQIMAALLQHQDTRDIPVIVYSALDPGLGMSPTSNVVEWISKSSEDPDGSILVALSEVLGQSPQGFRVLIVEDDFDLASILVSIFENHQLEAVHAQTGKQAITLSRTYRPDLVVLDLGPPDIEGFEVMETLRQDDALARIPMVVYTARDLDDEARTRLRSAGVQVFTKSRITPEEFEQRVLSLVKNVIRNTVTEEA